jgi:hypothetical protein
MQIIQKPNYITSKENLIIYAIPKEKTKIAG